MQANQYGSLAQCLQQLPSEGQMQVVLKQLSVLSFYFNCLLNQPTLFVICFKATAAEVQSLLVSGRKKEALQCAQEGQLWGPALILAAQLGDQVCLVLRSPLAPTLFILRSLLS